MIDISVMGTKCNECPYFTPEATKKEYWFNGKCKSNITVTCEHELLCSHINDMVTSYYDKIITEKDKYINSLRTTLNSERKTYINTKEELEKLQNKKIIIFL